MAIQSPGDIQQLSEISDRIKQRATTEVFGFINVDNDLKLDKPQLEVSIDREKASLLGVSVADIARLNIVRNIFYANGLIDTDYPCLNCRDVMITGA
jgi:multidrug efflux pump subunit AcrB